MLGKDLSSAWEGAAGWLGWRPTPHSSPSISRAVHWDLLVDSVQVLLSLLLAFLPEC